MVQTTVRLPDGQNFTVIPVFAGLLFKSNELTTHHNPFPVGWTIVLHTQDDAADAAAATAAAAAGPPSPAETTAAKPHVHSFRKPTLQNDSLFISSISNPSSSDFKPAASPTRQIAMMVWVSLYWYFHQPAPERLLPATAASGATPVEGRPRGEWRIAIKRDGVLRGRNLIPKLERMGLIMTADSAVGDDSDDGWDHMYVTQSMFWQIPAKLFLFTLQPTAFPGSPTGSRPGSPVFDAKRASGITLDAAAETTAAAAVAAVAAANAADSQRALASLASVQSFPIGPFFSTSHLPTYYPPAPLRYTMTNGIRHPARPKPPRMGEVFYTRFVPSAGQYLSFRVASSSPHPVPYLGPVSGAPPPDTGAAAGQLTALADTALLQLWMAKPRVSAFWGAYQDGFLSSALASKHSFPAIGLWDGVPFGYFEIYWVKEDVLGRHIGAAAADDFDRGIHVFVGEEWARGRVQLWLSSLVHWVLSADNRTPSVCIEPRVDNTRFIQHLQLAGFNKQREVSFPHKQSWFGRLQRDGWSGPAL